MITIIFGKPRVGKTALMTHFLVQEMFNRERILKMKSAIRRLNTVGGFNYSIRKHCVVANYYIKGHKHGYRPRVCRHINPYRLGYQDETNTLFGGTHLLEPYTVIGITEGQKYLNARKSIFYPDWQSRWYEQHGHDDYDIYIDVQRPNLIDVNIRELACFIEIVSKKDITKDGFITGIVWTVRRIDDSFELDKYFASGKKDKTSYKEETIKIDYNVLNCYNSQMCKPKFYQGHLSDDFDTQESEPVEMTKDGIIKYLQELDDELPSGFYQIKGR